MTPLVHARRWLRLLRWQAATRTVPGWLRAMAYGAFIGAVGFVASMVVMAALMIDPEAVEGALLIVLMTILALLATWAGHWIIELATLAGGQAWRRLTAPRASHHATTSGDEVTG